MANKQTELHVDDLLNSFDSRNVTTKGNKDTKAAKPDNNDWDEQEEDNFALGIGRTQQPTKTKAKKKTAAKGWGDLDAGSAPQEPNVQEIASTQEGEKKKKLFIKPNGQPKAPVNFETDAEYFPSLGEERPKQAPKKPEPTPVAQPVATSSGGVRKFVNAKKQAGETFAPLEPVQERALPVVPEKTEPVVQQKTPGFGFQRRAAEEQQQPKEVPADTKFKFGGEGPKKFSTGGKISFKREEEKSELERAREEKEREIEERLAREREELAKTRDQREPKKFVKGEEKNDSPKTKLENTEKVEKVEEKTEQPVEEKRIAKFSNSKKEAEKKVEPVVEQKAEEVAEVKVSGPVENVEMNGTLSNKGWGDGPLKKAQKK